MTTAKRNGIFFWGGSGARWGGVVIRKLLLNGRGKLTFGGRGTKFGREEYTGGNFVFPGEEGRANFRPVVGTLSLSPL